MRVASRTMNSALIIMASITTALIGQSRPTTRPVAEAESRSGTVEASEFARLFQFCPAKVESVMCVANHRLPDRLRDFLVPREEGAKVLPRVKRSLFAARKFSMHGHQGDFEGVMMSEFEERLATPTDAASRKVTREVINGVECFLEEGSKEGQLESWSAVIDGTILILATRRAVLEEILARRGPTLQTCIANLGWDSSEINWASPIVIVRKYDPSNQKDAYSPVSVQPRVSPSTRGFKIDGMTFAYDDATAVKARIKCKTQDPEKALKYFRELLGDTRELDQKAIATVNPAGIDGDLRTFSVTINEDPQHLEQLFIMMLFGLNIAI
jgi:hypothetical protein